MVNEFEIVILLRQFYAGKREDFGKGEGKTNLRKEKAWRRTCKN